MIRTTALGLTLCLASFAGAEKPPTGTSAGTTLTTWTRSPTTWSTGVSTGADVGPRTSIEKDVDYTPDDGRRNKALGPVRLKLRVDRGEIALNANSAGDRPAERAATPQRIELSVVESGGWKITGDCKAPISSPASLREPAAPGGATVQLAQACAVDLSGGEDHASITISVAGDGELAVQGSFGKASVHDGPPGPVPSPR